MVKKESKRVMEQRKRNCDRISFVVNKDAKYLIRARALREGVSSAEMMRRAILARCGLENWPEMHEWPPAHGVISYNSMVNCSDKESAARAIEALQQDEFMNANIRTEQDDDTFYIYMPETSMKDEYLDALSDLIAAVDDAEEPWASGKIAPMHIKISKKSLFIVRRLLSNIDEISDDELSDDYYDC